jgi:AraC-like DNA-binding protein
MKVQVKKAKAIIETKFSKLENVKDISKRLGCNYHTLRAAFVKETGYTLIEYLCEIKCMYARSLLERKKSKILIIALEAGFNDEKYFIKVFKKRYGVGPDEYRRNLKKTID